jgi:4-amino-4-deoxy-L-arabinose transferase-like glycosyltransferase
MPRSTAEFTPSLAKRGGNQAVAATAIIVLWLGLLWSQAAAPGDLRRFDQPRYLTIAYDLLHLHRFTDGSGFAVPHVDPMRPPGMEIMPLYPAFLGATALLNPTFDRSLSCFVERSDAASCPHAAPLPRALQVAMTAGVFLMLWRIAVRATGSQKIGWLSLGLGLLAAPGLIRSANLLMTETLTLFFVTGAMAAAVEAAKARRPLPWLFLSGAMIGLAAMTRPEFVYLLPAAAIGGVCIAACRPQRWRGVTLAAAFLLGGAVVVGPWIIRNAVVVSRPAMTSTYASDVLAQRVAFDLMTWHEYARAYLCWLPDGNGMGNLLLGRDACEQFQFEQRPDTFYWIGNTTFNESTIAAAGGADRQFGYLLHHYILAQPLWHALVSIPMALHGLWIDHYWGMILAVLCVPLTLGALRRGDEALLAVTLPGWFMLAFHAAVAVNQPRYNLMLIIPFSLAGGVALDRLWHRWAGSRHARDASRPVRVLADWRG